MRCETTKILQGKKETRAFVSIFKIALRTVFLQRVFGRGAFSKVLKAVVQVHVSSRIILPIAGLSLLALGCGFALSNLRRLPFTLIFRLRPHIQPKFQYSTWHDLAYPFSFSSRQLINWGQAGHIAKVQATSHTAGQMLKGAAVRHANCLKPKSFKASQ